MSRLVFVTSFSTGTWFGTLVRVNQDGSGTDLLNAQGLTLAHLVEDLRTQWRARARS